MNFRLLFALFFVGLITNAQDTYLQCGKILDVKSGKLQSEKTIVVSGNKIKSILDGYVSGTTNDSVVDLKSKIVLPGFIDMHVHIESESSPSRYLERFTALAFY